MAGYQSFGSGSGSGSGSGYQSFGSGGSNALSPTQIAALQQAAGQNKGTSLLGDIKGLGGGLLHGSGSLLGKSLELLGRPVSAVDSAITQGAAAGDKWDSKTLGAIGSGFWKGLSGKKHDTFADYIRAEYPKFAAHHKTSTALIGLAGTLATDPTLPLIVGAQAIPGLDVAVDQAEAAKLASLMGTSSDAAENLAHATKALDAMNAATRSATDTMFSARKGLADLEIERSTAELAGTAGRSTLEKEYAVAGAAAKVEEAQYLRKALQLKYSVPFSGGKSIPLSPVFVGGKRVAPLLPTLAGTAAKSIPFVSAAAGKVGEAFVHGFGHEGFDKPALAAMTKAKELTHDAEIRRAHVLFSEHFQNMSEKDIRKALDFGETRPGIVKVGAAGQRTLNTTMVERAVRHGELTHDQATFLTKWHDTMEHLRQGEADAGVRYKDTVGDKVYVPHGFKREGGFAFKSEIAGEYGFQKDRVGDLTLEQLRGTMENHPDRLQLIHNPAEILAKRIEQSAGAQSRQILRNVLAKSVGVPDKIPDVEARREALKAVRALMKKQRDLHTLTNLHGMRTAHGQKWARIANEHLNKLLGDQHKALDKIDRRIAFHNEQLHNPAEFTPTVSDMRKLSRKTFRDRIQHFQGPDKIHAELLWGEMSEVKRIASKLAKIPKKRGGSQADIKAIGDEINTLLARINKRRGTSFERIDFTPNRGARENWRGNITSAIKHADRMVSTEYDTLRGGYKVGAKTDHTAAIGRLEKRREQLVTEQADKITALKGTLAGRKAMDREKLDKQFEREAAQHINLDKEISRTQRRYHKMKQNPDIPEGFRKWETRIGRMQYHFPDEVHEAMTNLEKVANNPGVDKQLADTFKRVMGAWKLGVTSVNPGYRVRNTASDVWNMYISGIPMPRIVQYSHKAFKLQQVSLHAARKVANGEELTNTEFKALRDVNEMQLHGVLSGLFQGDVQKVARMFSNGSRARDYLRGTEGRNIFKAYIKLTSDANRHAENLGRMTHYMYRRSYQHMNPRDAAEWVKKAHFDYEELTPFERDKMKLIFPFYTWTRKDLPYQLSQMVNRPGKYQVFADVVNTSNELAGGGNDAQPGLMPNWMRESYMFKVPGFGQNAMMNPMIGVTDLQAIEHPRDFARSNMNPIFKGVDAALTGNNPDTGQPIVGTHPRNPVTGLGAALLSAIPGSNVGPTSRMSGGKQIQGEGANPWFTYIASQTPLSNLLISGLSPIKTAQRGGTLQTALGYGAGISVYNRDLTNEQTGAQLQFQDHMKQVIRGLRDTGAIAPAKKKKASSYQQQINQMLRGGS